jgi:hypothetical protein
MISRGIVDPGHQQLRLEDLGGPRDLQERAVVRVADREPVRQELVVVGQQAQHLLHRALPHLNHAAQPLAVLVEHAELVGHLESFARGLTTRIGSVNRVPPPESPLARPLVPLATCR